MNFAKTIKIFLVDCDTAGRLICELSNWSGKSYKIPRNLIKNCADRPDLLKTTGVYLLINRWIDTSERGQLYIGEAEDILKRLSQHVKEKDFWSEAIVFISKDDNLNKAHIKYLENRLHYIASQANRYEILNTQKPTPSNISESEKAEMEEFLSNALILISILGYNAFIPIREAKANDSNENEEELFYITATRGAIGIGKPTAEGFVVLKNSKVADPVTNSYPKKMQELRSKMITEGTIKKNKNYLIFQKDHLFSSSSTAAMIIMGRSANGLTEWRLKSGIKLRDFEMSENN